MTTAEPWRESAKDRGTVVMTLLLDTLVIVTAIGCRWLVLGMMAKLAPVEQQNFVVVWLERISNYGIVFAAAIFTTFDLAKVVVRSTKALMREVKT